MIRLFTGFDDREAIGWHVFCQSVMAKVSEPVEIVPITTRLAKGLRGGGTNAFTRSRFLVPSLCGYSGWALFMDGADMMARDDIAKLWAFRNIARKSLWCVKHEYKTRHARKYVGTAMEADNLHYDRKNWASLFLIDCSSPLAQTLTPERVESASLLELLQLQCFQQEDIGSLPLEWNWLIGEYKKNEDAKIAHYTLGIPSFAHYADSDFAHEWRFHATNVNLGVQPCKR